MSEYYGRMDVMSMSDEEIRRILKEEGSALPEGVAAMMLDELKKREEQGQAPDLGLSEEEIAEINASGEDDEEENEAEEPEEPEKTEDPEEDPDENEEESSPEEKFEQLQKEIEKQNADNKRTLIIACVCAAVVSIGSVIALLILRALGKL